MSKNSQLGNPSSFSGEKKDGIIVHEVATEYFPIRLMKGTDKFPNTIPPLMSSAHAARDHRGYVAKKKADYRRTRDRNLIECISQIDEYGAKFNQVVGLMKPFFSDYDVEHVLPATVGLSYLPAYSTDLDNLGTVGIDTDVEYPEDVLAAVQRDYESFGPWEEPSGLSMPRNRFIGYPFMIGGGQRELNDVFLALSAAIVNGGHKSSTQGNSLENIYDKLRPFHGDPFALQGTRLQTTAKEMAVLVNEGVFSSFNASPRPRMILMVDKLSVMDIRPEIKRMLEVIKGHPVHTQDRKEITMKIEGWIKSGFFVVGADQSKFDFRHGGKRGRQQLLLHSRILKSEKYLKSATTAFDMRSFTYGHGDIWEIPGDSALKSGMGTTTLVGCTGNYVAMVAGLSKAWNIPPDKVTALRGSKWDIVVWGDDSVIALSSSKDWELLKDALAFYKLEVTEEPTVKYLGSNYAAGAFGGSWDKGYSVGRFFQQQFFPERTKLYPFNLLGYIARLDLMGAKAKDVHNALQGKTDLGFEENFKFEDRHTVLRSLLPEIQKHSDKIGLVDDVLQIFTHGMDNLQDVSSGYDDIYYDLLGLSKSADLTDPTKYLSGIKEETMSLSVTSKITPEILKGVEAVSNGDFRDYSRLVSQMTAAFKLSSNAGSVIY